MGVFYRRLKGPRSCTLWKAEEVSARSGSIEKVRRLKIELNELYDKEERMWHQKSWLQWLKCGDQNTKFFHGSATQRKRRNFIKGLREIGRAHV